MTLTNEQVEFITGNNNEDSQTGLPEPESTIQVIRSLNNEDVFDIDFENLDITVGDNTTGYTIHFYSITAMYMFVADQIG